MKFHELDPKKKKQTVINSANVVSYFWPDIYVFPLIFYSYILTLLGPKREMVF